MLAILKRETKSYFTGMIGYVVVAVFLAVLGLYFTNQNLMFASPDFGGVLYTCTILLLFLLPALSMRSFAEERRAKTDQLLLTSPVSIPGIVLGTFGRFVCAFLSGVIFFGMYAPEGQNVLVYSAVYNGFYLIPEAVICLVIASIPQIRRLAKQLALAK